MHCSLLDVFEKALLHCFPLVFPGRSDEVPRDANGRPILPIQLGPSMVVLSLGRIVTNRPMVYNSQSYIWPLGFRSQRMYASYVAPNQRVNYLCEIVDRDNCPEFRITAEDDPKNPISCEWHRSANDNVAWR
eukprot:scaffold25443_cov37-Prasinocladus_malaysianus.AAC.1